MKSQTLRLESTPTHQLTQSVLYVEKYQLVPRPHSPPYLFVFGRYWDMERKSVHIAFGCVLTFFLYKLCLADKICSVSSELVTIKENNTIDTVVAYINTTTKDVTLTLIQNPDDAFDLKGSFLIVKKKLDFETLLNPEQLAIQIRCNKTGFKSVTLTVLVQVENINDNPPNFAKSEYAVDVNELTPVNTSVALIEAKDDDSGVLYYTMEQTLNMYFRLESIYKPNILVNKVLDYDVVQQVTLTLYVQDTPSPPPPDQVSHTASTTIKINIQDIDNRPPWFQPCTRTNFGIAKICLSPGYKGRVNLTEKQEGPLQLQPGPVYARDGDRSRNEEISYKIVRGNEDSIFQIDEATGNITMLKPADIAGPISLTVLASQVSNRDQFAATSVNIEVMKKSRNPPKFERERYEAYVYTNSGPENMVLRDRTTNRPFRARARDDDFATGVNPDIRYEVQYSSYVNVTTDGFVLLKKAVRTDSFALQLRAVDVSTGESGTAALSVLVLPPVGVQSPSEGYRAGDMALLGFVMAALLVLCLIVIGYLISRLKKQNPGTLKLSECLGPCLQLRRATNRPRPRDSLQFTNDGFLNEGDMSRFSGRRMDRRDRRLDSGRVRVVPRERQRHCNLCGMRVHTNHVHRGSPVGHLKARGSKDQVKSILTKERRKQGRHKTVWFKESEDSSDIEVEIIPDNIGLRPEEDLEKFVEDSSSPAVRASDVEMGELTMMNIQDLDSQEGPNSNHREGMGPDKTEQ
ncbi:cadherin-related family member 5 isoform X2 [Astyanax mexicanus]|uniref:cadherin-related family member 5 isoform X2 n=1 Tax=Astyanax mexicanus TaxID=7994 RepID=UPI0020CB2F1D|nr:cadherin-related family member 5 isoform X2 [Astyanax mexicanus]